MHQVQYDQRNGQRSGREGKLKQQRGHKARLYLTPSQIKTAEGQGHAARTMWNCLHSWWTMLPKDKRNLADADAAIRQGRKDLDFLADLPAQAAQQVLKTYFRAWQNCWDGRAGAPNFKGRFRSRMAIDIPQGRDLQIVRLNRRWGRMRAPKIGHVLFRWTKDLPVGKRADKLNKVTGARLVREANGWHVVFRIQTEVPDPEPHQGPNVGIDRGIAKPLALSDGTFREHSPWLTPGETVSFEEVLAQQTRRDTDDQQRAYGGLRKGEGAVTLLTDGLSPEQVLTQLLEIVCARQSSP
jgi:putative transposase